MFKSIRWSRRIAGMIAKVALAALLLLGVLSATVIVAQGGLQLPWNAVSNGGGQRSSDGFRLLDTLGQAATGQAASANFALGSGFLTGVSAEAIMVIVRNFGLPWSAASSGGGQTESANFALLGAVGQSSAGQSYSGNFALAAGFLPGPRAQVPIFEGVCGDQNDDGMVDVLDVVIDLQIAVELIDPTPAQAVLSDLNGDGTVNVLDAIAGLQHIVGIVPTLDECGPMAQ